MLADHYLSRTGSFIFSYMNVREYYHQALAEKGYRADQAQEQAIDRLQRYYDEWVEYRKMRSSTLRRMFSRPEVPRGVYLWGGVGRGLRGGQLHRLLGPRLLSFGLQPVHPGICRER